MPRAIATMAMRNVMTLGGVSLIGASSVGGESNPGLRSAQPSRANVRLGLPLGGDAGRQRRCRKRSLESVGRCWLQRVECAQ